MASLNLRMCATGWTLESRKMKYYGRQSLCNIVNAMLSKTNKRNGPARLMSSTEVAPRGHPAGLVFGL